MYSACFQYGRDVDIYAVRRTFDAEWLELRKHCSALCLVSFALFSRFLAFAFAWGPALKILLWCDESSPDFKTLPLCLEAPVI